jgi:hypothetical protein
VSGQFYAFLLEKNPCSHIGGWVNPIVGLEVLEKRKVPVPAGIRTQIFQPGA